MSSAHGRVLLVATALLASALMAPGATAQDLDERADRDDPDRFDDEDGEDDDDPGEGGDPYRLPTGDPDEEDDLGQPLIDRDDELEPSLVDDVDLDTPAVPGPEMAPSLPRKPRFFRDISGGLPPAPVTAVAIDPGDPEIFLVGTDGFVFKSDDAGESWRPTLAFPRGLATDLLVDDAPEDGEGSPDDDDYGEDPEEREFDPVLGQQRNVEPVDRTDQQQLGYVIPEPQFLAGDDLPEGDFDLEDVIQTHRESVGVRRIRFVAASVGTVYVGTPRGAFRSVDAGESWQRLDIPGGAPANDVRDIAVDPGRPSRLWLATRGGLLVSPDGGVTFDAASTGGRIPAVTVLAATIDDEEVVMVGTDRGLWRSWDGGQSFRQLLLQGAPPTLPVSEVALDEKAKVFYAGTPLGLFVAERRMAILEPRLHFGDLSVLAISIDPGRPRGVALGTPGEGLFVSDDTAFSRVEFEDRFPAQSVFGIARPGDDPDALVVATERGVFIHQVGSGVQVSLDRWRVLEDVFSREPTLPEVLDVALRHQRVHPAQVATFEQRAGLSALAPRVVLQYQLTIGRPEEQDQYVLVGDEPDDYDEDEVRDVLDLLDLGLAVEAPQRGFLHKGWIQMRWNLDRIVFNSDARASLAYRPLQRLAEERVANKVQVLYGARRRLLIEIYLEGAGLSASERMSRELRLDELTSLLDGATGGAFSEISTSRGADPATLTRPGGPLSPDGAHPKPSDPNRDRPRSDTQRR